MSKFEFQLLLKIPFGSLARRSCITSWDVRLLSLNIQQIPVAISNLDSYPGSGFPIPYNGTIGWGWTVFIVSVDKATAQVSEALEVEQFDPAKVLRPVGQPSAQSDCKREGLLRQ